MIALFTQLPLAQGLTGNQQQALFWLAILLAVVILGGAAILLIRNKFLSKDEDEQPAGFTLSDLRELRDSGEMSNEEYEAARAKMIAKVKQSLEADTEKKRKQNERE